MGVGILGFQVQGDAYCAAWSPDGHLFALATQALP